MSDPLLILEQSEALKHIEGVPLLAPYPPFGYIWVVEYHFIGSKELEGFDEVDFFIPAYFVSDGASIPRSCWSLLGATPFDPRLIKAAGVHDYLLATGLGDKETADKLFYALLLKAGVDKTTASLMYEAVDRFGRGNY